MDIVSAYPAILGVVLLFVVHHLPSLIPTPFGNLHYLPVFGTTILVGIAWVRLSIANPHPVLLCSRYTMRSWRPNHPGW